MPVSRILPAAALLASMPLAAVPVAAQTVPPAAQPVPVKQGSLFYPPQNQSLAALPGSGRTPVVAPVVAPGARPVCPMGRTATGVCVNPYVAKAGIDAAIAFGQSSISETERPYPASKDTTYSYPANVASAPPVTTRQTLYNGNYNEQIVTTIPGFVRFGNGGTIANRQRGE